MKDVDPKVDPQIDMVQDRYGIMRQRVTHKIVYTCKYHTYAKQEDLIDVFVKHKNETVKRCKFCEDQKAKNKMEAKKVWESEKDQVTDYFVRRTFNAGSRGTGKRLAMHEIPDVLVETKQAVIKIKRLTDKLNAPLKKCTIHGNLYRDDVIKNGLRKNGDIVWKCRACMKDMHAKHYKLNKLLVSQKAKKYRKDNAEKVAMIKKESRLRNKFKYVRETTLLEAYSRHALEKSKIARKHNKTRDDSEGLTDEYIKRLMTKRSGLKAEDIPQSLVEVKRALVQLRRGVQKKRDEQIYNYIEESENGKDKKR